VPWEEKEQAFVMIGRIAPEKQVENAIAILEAVRQRGHTIRLHLCGQIENDLYGQRIEQLCREHADWIVPEGRVSGAKKAQILTHCRFGLQTRAAEPFGISVAELVKAGAITFASAGGGQAEILQHSDLLFSSVDDAVEKIIPVLDNPSIQSTLRAHLANQAQRFSAQSFVHGVRALIADLLTIDPSDSCNITSQAS
jgi:glycosyltransferase involved in cell wall biosynthesis